MHHTHTRHRHHPTPRLRFKTLPLFPFLKAKVHTYARHRNLRRRGGGHAIYIAARTHSSWIPCRNFKPPTVCKWRASARQRAGKRALIRGEKWVCSCFEDTRELSCFFKEEELPRFLKMSHARVFVNSWSCAGLSSARDSRPKKRERKVEVFTVFDWFWGFKVIFVNNVIHLTKKNTFENCTKIELHLSKRKFKIDPQSRDVFNMIIEKRKNWDTHIYRNQSKHLYASASSYP